MAEQILVNGDTQINKMIIEESQSRNDRQPQIDTQCDPQQATAPRQLEEELNEKSGATKPLSQQILF